MLSPIANPTTALIGSHGSKWCGIVTGLALIVAMSGCGASGPSTVDPAKADDMLSRINNAMEDKDWETVDSTATAAIESNMLDAGQVEDARIARTQARIESGNMEGAEQDLVFLENADSPDKADQIYVLKATYQLKTGKKAEARKTFMLAKKINKKIKAPAGL
ncbi:MAG: hypothetical protein U0929_11925 [Planctomycetaceae bacterium]